MQNEKSSMYFWKFGYRKVLMPIARRLLFINPDIISYTATLLAGLTMLCYIFALKYPMLLIVSIALTFLRMTCNTIDGVIAIERGNLRLKGEVVNALPDRYSDIFALAGVALSPLCSPIWGIIGLSSTFLVSYAGMLGKAIGVQWQHHGPLDKVCRLILLMIFSLLQYFAIVNGHPSVNILGINFTYFELCMVMFLVLGQYTVYNRVNGQLVQARELENSK